MGDVLLPGGGGGTGGRDGFGGSGGFCVIGGLGPRYTQKVNAYRFITHFNLHSF